MAIRAWHFVLAIAALAAMAAVVYCLLTLEGGYAGRPAGRAHNPAAQAGAAEVMGQDATDPPAMPVARLEGQAALHAGGGDASPAAD